MLELRTNGSGNGRGKTIVHQMKTTKHAFVESATQHKSNETTEPADRANIVMQKQRAGFFLLQFHSCMHTCCLVAQLCEQQENLKQTDMKENKNKPNEVTTTTTK